jgi:hypothetical protein
VSIKAGTGQTVFYPGGATVEGLIDAGRAELID